MSGTAFYFSVFDGSFDFNVDGEICSFLYVGTVYLWPDDVLRRQVFCDATGLEPAEVDPSFCASGSYTD
jgi:hypothetical protein